MLRTIFKKTSRLTRNPFPAQGYGIHARRSAARASSLPPLAKRVAGRPTRGAAQSGGGGASPRRFVDDQARLSMAALAQPPQHHRRPLASPSHPPPYPSPPLGFAERGEGGAGSRHV